MKDIIKIPWTLFAAEFLGTALLVGVGVSFVILDFGSGSPVVKFIPDAGLRRAITGFLFGSTGALIAVSWIGKESGAHINPVVTLAFLVRGKISSLHAAGYIFFQLIGGIAGALPLLLWGRTGSSISFGGTYPGQSLPHLLSYSFFSYLLVIINYNNLLLCYFRYFMPLWYLQRHRYPARAPIPPVVWDLQSYQVTGRHGGYTGLLQWPEH